MTLARLPPTDRQWLNWQGNPEAKMVKPTETPTVTTVTIKSVPVDAWDAARKAAAQRGETQGEWVGRACERQAALERGDIVLPPGQAAPAPAAPPAAPPATAAELQAFAALLHAMGTAGAQPTQTVVARFNRVLNLQLGAALGLPPPKPRQPKPRSITQESTAAPAPALPAPAPAGED
jgi:hypothetical protein